MTQPDSLAVRLDVAGVLVDEAGALALGYFAKVASLAVEAKTGGQDVVSIADREVEQRVRQRVGAAFPDDGFLGEEYGFTPSTSGYVWVLDPIDGTSCFLHGIRNWCISLALMRDGKTVAGFIFDPTAGELFRAIAGRGATLNGETIRVDAGNDLRHGLVSVGANGRVPPRAVTGFIERLLAAGGMFVRHGSGALGLAHVACGRLAAYYEPHINAWDCLAGLCLIREAGGWTNDFEAGDLIAGGPVIGCAPQLRDEVLALIEATRLERTA
ncbi:inositol monophosphatase family protein [Ancylobacter defluvii]|uniref:Inositol-1-monophosphatase n=1 Tax=Ancylobacter defluvii TaxID=1282440 RepID=A0A9W6JZ49_9HYPH|nr:inositol monophosphatase [Ancylobacter defluvii]MBS7588958.1 inositol monophosphatase [Ancylobacter defluvii]GLK84559.1 inositol monophosphatase [Ancylobacter defluvii]